MAAPCALFASCSDGFDANALVKLILDTDTLHSSKHITESVEAYDWHINTKYYTADVNLCVATSRTIGNQEFAQAVQAFIVYFNPKEESSFELTKAWLPYLDQFEPEILILACDNCSHDDVVTRLRAQKWCIDNGFELVEINPIQDSDNDDVEDDFVETTGVKRIIQALHAHTWPNLVMKENPDIGSEYFRQLMKEESELKALEDQSKQATETCQIPSQNSNNNDGTTTENIQTEEKEKVKETEKPNKVDIVDSLLPDDDMALLAALGNEDPGEESFEQVFEKLQVMKEKAEALPPSQRKMYAEKIAISFWKAIGGDEDEIDGLDNSDDELKPS